MMSRPLAAIAFSVSLLALLGCGEAELSSKREQFRNASATTQPRVIKKVVIREGNSAGKTTSAGTQFETFQSLHGAFSADRPVGSGWSSPYESTPNTGLYRTTFDGPGDLTVLIDYTPAEVPVFSGTPESEQVISTESGTATEIVFAGGDIPICQATRCVDYLITDPSGSGGWGVLAGGGDFALAQEVARRVAQSLSYYDA